MQFRRSRQRPGRSIRFYASTVPTSVSRKGLRPVTNERTNINSPQARRGVTAYQVHRGPVLRVVGVGEREPREVVEFLQHMLVAGHCALALEGAHLRARAARIGGKRRLGQLRQRLSAGTTPFHASSVLTVLASLHGLVFFTRARGTRKICRRSSAVEQQFCKLLVEGSIPSAGSCSGARGRMPVGEMTAFQAG